MKNKFSRGFTLAELMAVVVIIAILSGIAIGSYRRSVDRARFTEAQTVAQAVAAARDTYYFDNAGIGSSDTYPLYFKLLPIELKDASGSDCSNRNCQLKDFTIYIDQARYVKAVDKDGHFGLCVYQETLSTGKTAKEACLGLDDEGKDMCKLMGYTPVANCETGMTL